ARAGEVSYRAARWGVGPGVVGATIGAYLTKFVNPHVLLLVASTLIGLSGTQVIRGRAPSTPWEKGKTPVWKYGVIALGAGFASGLLGVGGGIIIVPALTLLIGMPLKRALGTSLVLIAALVVPGTLVHAALGHIDWTIFLVLVAGVIPGAWLGARIALGARERTLRLAVGAFLVTIAVVYGIEQIVSLLGDGG
ncbi:MAG: sulfite exporter TauE/SafE family protein, partial [Actinomycetota bacterium]